MAQFKKGDVVVCINSGECLPYGPSRSDVEKGHTYAVEDCRMGVSGSMMLFLKELETTPLWAGRFVKIEI